MIQDISKLVDFVTVSNWLLLALAGMIALASASQGVYLGIICGGLIGAVNFHALKKTVKNSLSPNKVMEKGNSLLGNVLVKYYIRFLISGMVIFLLISKHIVHPLGLLAGLSVVVASIFLATMFALTRLLFKEAV